MIKKFRAWVPGYKSDCEIIPAHMDYDWKYIR